MGTYASRRGPSDSPNVPDPFIFPEEEQAVSLMDEIEERGDQARDEITTLVRKLCTRIAEQNSELEQRAAPETRAGTTQCAICRDTGWTETPDVYPDGSMATSRRCPRGCSSENGSEVRK